MIFRLQDRDKFDSKMSWTLSLSLAHSGVETRAREREEINDVEWMGRIANDENFDCGKMLKFYIKYKNQGMAWPIGN